MKMHPLSREKSTLFLPSRGFSLVELSIVLVILGLLVGGVLSGQSLIRASELRKVTTEYTSIVAAVGSFREKYLYLPGDFPNASQFWGAAAAGAGCWFTPNPGTVPTCSGNGDGRLSQVNYTPGGIYSGRSQVTTAPNGETSYEKGMFW
jgi:prepilin-type N-terminal cleavage/methylation domain-containing protein